MLKKLKSLLHNVDMIPELQEKLILLSIQMQELSKPSENKYSFPAVSLHDKELTAARETYEKLLRDRAYNSMKKYKDDLQACFEVYDKLLYKASGRITSGNYTTLIDTIYKLDVLRGFIYQCLFDTTDIFSFYLYLVGTDQMYRTLNTIPAINIDKVFMLDEVPVYEHDVEYYVRVHMDRYRFTIDCPMGTYEFAPMYRKTVLRVLYSIYTKKYILYHLYNENTEEVN